MDDDSELSDYEYNDSEFSDSGDELVVAIQNNINIVLTTQEFVSNLMSLCVPPSLQVRNDRQLSGYELVTNILAHPGHSIDLFRMSSANFDILCQEILVQGIVVTSNMPIVEQVGMFLQILGQGHTVRTVAEVFQHSLDTVYICFKNVLESVLLMQDRYIRLPDANSLIHHSVRESPFKGALGAIDGTHVPAHVHKKYYLGGDGTCSLDRFRNRKGDITQNVLAAVDFDMKFVHVHAGFEGSAHDSKVLGKAIDTSFTVPSGRYYLVDGGYSNTPSFISPYRSYLYHLAQFRERTRRQLYRCPEDKFNRRHTLLRNIVERAFGLLKGRFKILQFKRPYIYPRQVDIVIACCVMHNFFKCQNGIYNNIDERFEREGTALNEDGSVDGSNLDVLAGLRDRPDADDTRNAIRDALWRGRFN